MHIVVCVIKDKLEVAHQSMRCMYLITIGNCTNRYRV